MMKEYVFHYTNGPITHPDVLPKVACKHNRGHQHRLMWRSLHFNLNEEQIYELLTIQGS